MPDSPTLPPEAVEAGEIAMQELLAGDGPLSYSRQVEAILTAALPHLRAAWEGERATDWSTIAPPVCATCNGRGWRVLTSTSGTPTGPRGQSTYTCTVCGGSGRLPMPPARSARATTEGGAHG